MTRDYNMTSNVRYTVCSACSQVSHIHYPVYIGNYAITSKVRCSTKGYIFLLELG